MPTCFLFEKVFKFRGWVHDSYAIFRRNETPGNQGIEKKTPFDPPRKLKKIAKGPKVLYIHGKWVARYMANDSENENIFFFSMMLSELN